MPIIYNKKQIETLLKWCEDDDDRSFITNKIHSCRGKHKHLRGKLCLNENELLYIEINGLSEIREDVQSFIENYNITSYKPIKIKTDHPMQCAKYACGICCRKCIETVHKIPILKKISEAEVKALTILTMKWLLKVSSQLDES